MELLILIAVLLPLFLFAGAVVAFRTQGQAGELRRDLARLTVTVSRLNAQVERLSALAALAPEAAAAGPHAPTPAVAPVAEAAAAPGSAAAPGPASAAPDWRRPPDVALRADAAPISWGGQPVPDAQPAAAALPPPLPAAAQPAEAPPPRQTSAAERVPGQPVRPPPAPPAAARPKGPSWDRVLAERWMVWLGGLALIIGTGFLMLIIVAAIGPVLRTLMGLGAGLALVFAAERLRRAESVRAPAEDLVDRLKGQAISQVPATLAGTGIGVLFLTLWAAHRVAELFGPVLAFPLLAATAAFAFALSYRHGAALAGLGLIGGLLVPLMMRAEEPNLPVLYSYLAAVCGMAMRIGVARAVPWLPAAAVAGGFLWGHAGLTSLSAGPADYLAGGLFAGGLFGLLTLPRAARLGTSIALELPHAGLILFGGLAALAAGSAPAWPFAAPAGLIVITALALLAARREAGLELLPALCALPWLALLLLAQGVSVPLALPLWAWQAALVLALAGLVAARPLPGLAPPDDPFPAAALAGLGPAAVLAAVWLRIGPAEGALAWTLPGLLLAGGALVAALEAGRRAERAADSPEVAAHALSVAAGLALALTLALEKAALTVGLALIVPAAAIIAQRIPLRALRLVAFSATASVVLRLTVNPDLLTYPADPWGGAGWILYGYGVPLVAFLAADRWFLHPATSRLSQSLVGAAVLLAVLLPTLLIRHLVHGGLDHAGWGFTEAALHAVTWMTGAVALHRLAERRTSPVYRIAWPLVGLAGGLTLVGLVLFNPVLTGARVAGGPVLNTLLIAYLMPALLCLAARERLKPLSGLDLPRLAALAAVFLTWVWVTLAVRQAFQGEVLTGRTGDAELYAWSLAWMLLAAALMGLGLVVRRYQTARLGGLALFALTALKVFFVDMTDLDGILRVLSFMGLGGVLILVGWAYGRLRQLDEPDDTLAAAATPRQDALAS